MKIKINKTQVGTNHQIIAVIRLSVVRYISLHISDYSTASKSKRPV